MRAVTAVRRLASSCSGDGYGLRSSLHAHSAAAAQPASEAWSSPSSPPRGPKWIFLGCPGVGKGTYASRLAKFLGIPHIAMGDLVRHELSLATASALKVGYSFFISLHTLTHTHHLSVLGLVAKLKDKQSR